MEPQTVYSPNQTRDWLNCPVYRQISREWRPRTPVGKRDLAAALGTAIAEGVYEYNNALALGNKLTPELLEGCRSKAVGSANQILAAMTESNPIPDAWLDYARQLSTYAELGTLGYIEQIKDRMDYLVEVAEYELPSRARLDIAILSKGIVEVVDLKTKLTITDRALKNYEDSYGVSGNGNQLYQYCWEYGEIIGRPVRDYRIHLLVVLPKPTLYEYRYHIPEERFQTWLQSAKRVWEDMAAEDRGERLPYQRRDNCRTLFGKCEFYQACHELYEDPTLMARYYEPIEGGK